MPPGSGFDWASGQMYTEKGLSGSGNSRSKPASWVIESPFLPVGWEEGSAVGTSSLKHMAMRQCLLDQRRLTADHFAKVPWHLALYLWEALGRSRKQTMYAWKIFATAYPSEFRELSQYHCMQLNQRAMRIPDYLGLLRSESLAWGTVLTLSTEFTGVSDLVGISSVVNLVALNISYFKPPKSAPIPEDREIITLNDRIIRSWSEQARTGTAFRHLRVLMVRGQHDLSDGLFRYLDSFPALIILVVAGCEQVTSDAAKKTAERYGWAEGNKWPCSEYLPAKYRSLADCKTIYDAYFNCFAFANNNLGGNAKYPFDSGTPILDFIMEPTKPHRESKKIWFFRQNPLGPVNARPETKKRKIGDSGDKGRSGHGNKNKGPRNPAMKRRGGKDISGLLADFYRYFRSSGYLANYQETNILIDEKDWGDIPSRLAR
ncbi:hypothetical protein FQN54_009433 [Arachnomyces sp. PD_36]|nr:hypothetical protein FQN54_009433 [Arachnomyces sp. PD_36]